ncbi:PAS domain S-box protein [Paracoccus chinensis]|nr:PAS domain S-box protein [Paracoccus chinensis]
MPQRDLLDTMLKRQKVLADFADFALQSDDLDEVLQEACRLVAAAMGTERAKVLEIEDDGDSLFLRAGIGWAPGDVGHLRLSMQDHSSESFAIRAREPVITRDIAQEDRFEVPDFMKKEGIVALVNVPIFLPRQGAFGLLQVDDTRPRDFDGHDSAFLRTYAGILGPIVDRLLRLRDLRATEERFRLTVEAAADYAIFVTDAEDRITDWLPGAAAVFGWTAEEVRGKPSAMLYTPEDRAAGVPDQERDTALRQGSAPDVRWHLRKDGSQVFIEGSRRALGHMPGGGFLKIGQDVTERRLADEQLRASEERLRLLGELAPALLWQADATGDRIELNGRALGYLGQSPGELQAGGWLDSVHPEDREATAQAFAEAFRSGQPLELQYRLRGRDGGYHWFLCRQVPWQDANGRLAGWFGAALDIDELRRLQMRQEVLVAELQHRTRNLIGVVRSVAHQTMGETGSIGAFREAFDHRLKALSRVQGLLSRAEHEPITLRALLSLELDALGAAEGQRLPLQGPPVCIRPSHAQTLALALHELATNARKHGALSGAGGRLGIRWELRDGPAGRHLHIDWHEDGLNRAGACPAEPRADGGYGRVLIEQALPHSLGARTTYALGLTELRCTIDLPLDAGTSGRS